MRRWTQLAWYRPVEGGTKPVQSRYKVTAPSLIQLARANSCFLSCRPRAHSIPLVAAQMGLSPGADVTSCDAGRP